MYQDVLNVLLDSLLERERNLVLSALLELTKMNPDKDLARLAHLEPGLLRRAPNLKLTAFQFVDMEPTAQVDLYLALNAPRIAILVSLILMASLNALLALTTSSPSNLVQMMSPCAEKSVPLDSTLKLDLPHVLPAQETSSSL